MLNRPKSWHGNSPRKVTHDSTAAENAISEIERLAQSDPNGFQALKQRFRRFEDFFIYKRASAFRANNLTAGFHPTGKLLKFLAAFGTRKTKDNVVRHG